LQEKRGYWGSREEKDAPIHHRGKEGEAYSTPPERGSPLKGEGGQLVKGIDGVTERALFSTSAPWGRRGASIWGESCYPLPTGQGRRKRFRILSLQGKTLSLFSERSSLQRGARSNTKKLNISEKREVIISSIIGRGGKLSLPFCKRER